MAAKVLLLRLCVASESRLGTTLAAVGTGSVGGVVCMANNVHTNCLIALKMVRKY